MALTTCNVTGRVALPDDSDPINARIVFCLNAVEVDGDVVVPRVISAAIGAGGAVDVELWPNARGTGNSVYSVKVELYGETHAARLVQTIDLGPIYVPDEATEDLDALVSAPVPALPITGSGGITASAAGTLAGRDDYDDEAPGFTYCVVDAASGQLEFYVRYGLPGTWAGPQTFRGEPGPTLEFSTLAEAEAWLATEEPADGVAFSIGELRYVTDGAATMLPIQGARWADVLDFRHFGDGLSATEDDLVAAIEYAGTTPEVKIIRGGNAAYSLTEAHTLTGLTDLVIDLTGTRITQDGTIGLGLEIGIGCERVHVLGGDWTGDKDNVTDWDNLLTGFGITDGDRTGVADATYSGVSTIGVTGLGVGYVKKGARVSFQETGTVYAFICQADAPITAGAATIALDRVLDVALVSGRQVFVQEYNRYMVLDAAASAGASTLTFRAPDPTSLAGVAGFRAGDEFAFYGSNNDIYSDPIDECYTVTVGSTFTADGLGYIATVGITPPLQTDKVLGQMITSIQDHRNNYMPILFYGARDCGIHGLHLHKAALHGIGCATNHAPWHGTFPKDNPNIGLTITGVRDSEGGRGSAIVGTWMRKPVIRNSVFGDPDTRRSAIIFERCEDGLVTGCRPTGMAHGIRFNGECRRMHAISNILDGCERALMQANACSEITFAYNDIVNDPTYSIGSVVVYSGSGQDDETGTVTENRINSTRIIGNNISGGLLTTNPLYGSGIQVSQINGRTDLPMEDWPRDITIEGNTIRGVPRHGINVQHGLDVDVLKNSVQDVGLSAINSYLSERLTIEKDWMVDAGMLTSSPAIKIDGGSYSLRRNASVILESEGQTYGIEVDGGAVLLDMGGNDFEGTIAPALGVSLAPMFNGLEVYADNAAALTAGLVPGQGYMLATGEVRVVVPA